MGTILIVEDDASFRRVLEYQLTEAGYETTIAESGERALELFSEHRYQVVLTDLNLPKLSGEEVLKQIKQQSPDTPVIILTAFASIESAVEAMKLGAFHYLTKPVNSDELLLTIGNAHKFAELAMENRNLREAVSAAFKFGGIIGSSKAMREVLDQAVAAEYLQRRVGDLAADLPGVQLGHGRFLGDVEALIEHPRRPIGEHRGSLDLGRHVG